MQGLPALPIGFRLALLLCHGIRGTSSERLDYGQLVAALHLPNESIPPECA
jgi:hypothetical protein